MDAILKSMVCVEVKMLVAPCTTDSRVSGMAMGVHHEMKTGSFREHSGRIPENRPSIRTTCVQECDCSYKKNIFCLLKFCQVKCAFDIMF